MDFYLIIQLYVCFIIIILQQRIIKNLTYLSQSNYLERLYLTIFYLIVETMAILAMLYLKMPVKSKYYNNLNMYLSICLDLQTIDVLIKITKATRKL